MKRRIALVLVLVALGVGASGCVDASPARIDGAARAGVPVDVYYADEAVKRCHVAIATLRVDAGEGADLDALLGAAATRARSLGGDAVVLDLRYAETPRPILGARAIRYVDASAPDARCEARE
jgi:hypothetical protein